MLWWTEDLKTGIETIDAQHKAIFNKADEILHFHDTTPIDQVKETFRFLTNYVIEHFGNEERIMIQTYYEEFEHHRHAHTYLICNLNKLNQKLAKEGVSGALIDAFQLLIIEWLINHINKDDKALASFVQKFGIQ